MAIQQSNMIPMRLDSYQKQVLQALGNHRAMVVHGVRNSGKSHLLRRIAAEFVFDGKKVLYLVDNNLQSDTIGKLMQAYQLGRETLPIHPFTGTGPGIREIIGESLKVKKLDDGALEWEQFDMEYRLLEKHLQRFYESLNAETLFDRPWHELVVKEAFDNDSIPLLHLNHLINPKRFDFNQAEYEALTSVLSIGFEWYRQGMAHTDRYFRVENFLKGNAADAWKDLSAWVATIKKQTVHIILGINQYLHAKGEKIQQQYIESCLELKRTIDQLEHSFRMLKIESTRTQAGNRKFNLFSAAKRSDNQATDHKKVPLIQAYHQCRSKLHRLMGVPPGEIHTEAANENDIDHYLDAIAADQELLSQCLRAAQKDMFSTLESINFNVSPDPALARIENDIQALYLHVNEQQFLLETFENTGFSLMKQLDQLESLLGEMNRIQAMAPAFHEHYDWNAFYWGLEPRDRYLIDKMLLIQPKDWMTFFRNWYQQNLIRFGKSWSQMDVDEGLEQFHHRSGHAVAVRYQAYGKFKEASLSTLNSNFGTKVKAVMKNEPSGGAIGKEGLFTLLRDAFPWMSTVFPLMIAPVEEGIALLKAGIGDWDLVLTDLDEGSSEMATDLIQTLRSGEKKLVISLEQKGDDLPGHLLAEAGLPHYLLKGKHQQSIIDLKLMNHTERLYAARNLAFLLENINPDITIFHLGSKILVSCLSGPLNEVLQQLLDEAGLKKMRILESPFHLLVENLLEVESEQILITQDGLINNRDFRDTDWQWVVRNKLIKGGVKLLDFKTHLLLESPHQAMMAFVGQLNPISPSSGNDSPNS